MTTPAIVEIGHRDRALQAARAHTSRDCSISPCARPAQGSEYWNPTETVFDTPSEPSH
jgi:hypothetical protein